MQLHESRVSGFSSQGAETTRLHNSALPDRERRNHAVQKAPGSKPGPHQSRSRCFQISPSRGLTPLTTTEERVHPIPMWVIVNPFHGFYPRPRRSTPNLRHGTCTRSAPYPPPIYKTMFCKSFSNRAPAKSPDPKPRTSEIGNMLKMFNMFPMFNPKTRFLGENIFDIFHKIIF